MRNLKKFLERKMSSLSLHYKHMISKKFNLHQHKEILLCCLEALNSLNPIFTSLTILSSPLKNTQISSKKIIGVPNRTLLYSDFRSIMPLAKDLALLISGHINRDQKQVQQLLLSQYLYKFRYFYKRFYFEQNKEQNYLQSSIRTTEINNIAIWAVFQLLKY